MTAQTTWNPDARPFLLPLGLPAGNFAAIGAGPPYPMAYSLAAGFKITVPFGFFLRGIVVTTQGTATPGPGLGSYGQLRALASFEADDRCDEGH